MTPVAPLNAIVLRLNALILVHVTLIVHKEIILSVHFRVRCYITQNLIETKFSKGCFPCFNSICYPSECDLGLHEANYEQCLNSLESKLGIEMKRILFSFLEFLGNQDTSIQAICLIYVLFQLLLGRCTLGCSGTYIEDCLLKCSEDFRNAHLNCPCQSGCKEYG